jgi:hypothetical protein
MRITQIIILSGFLSLVFATAQAPDILIYNNDTLSMHSNPLESYLETNPDNRPKSKGFSSANWRGYVAKWIIKDSLLWLVDVQVSEMKKKNGKISFKVSSEQKTVTGDTIPIIASWFTGNLQISMGELKEYVHMGYASTHEFYLLIEIKEGKIISIEKLSAEKMNNYRLKKFSEFKKTPQYDSLKSELSKQIGDTSNIDEFLFIYMTDL